jgi:hypothetical protein
VKTPTYGRWWLTEKHVDPDDDGAVHDDDYCDHRHFIRELNLGWQFWTPAGRLETIERMEPVDTSEFWWRIWTTQTGPGWSWRLAGNDRVHAIVPNPVAVPHLRFIDFTGAGMTPRMVIVLAADYDIPDFGLTLAEAHYLGTGLGWKMSDRPDGGDEAITGHPSKAKAKTALLKAGRTHAKHLGVPLYSEHDLDRR